MRAEVGAQSVAYHIKPEVVNYHRKLIYLLGREELSLVYEQPPGKRHVAVCHCAYLGVQVGIRVYPLAGALYAYA